MTSLNDLSRNRTLGLLIGKGFFSAIMSMFVVRTQTCHRCSLSMMAKFFQAVLPGRKVHWYCL